MSEPDHIMEVLSLTNGIFFPFSFQNMFSSVNIYFKTYSLPLQDAEFDNKVFFKFIHLFKLLSSLISHVDNSRTGRECRWSLVSTLGG